MSQRRESSVRRALRRLNVSLMLGAALSAVSGAAWSQTDQPADSTKLILGQISLSPSHLSVFVALENGLFKKAGLDVTIEHLSGGTPSAMASFVTGSVNMLVGGASEFIEYSGKKVISGKIIGEIADQTYDIVVSRDITNIQQLKGKTIGISGANGADQIYIEAVLAKNNISKNDVSFLTTGGQLNRIAALTASAAQAVALSDATREASSKLGNVLLKSADSSVSVPSSMLFANSDLVTNHNPLLKKFVGVLGEATVWMRAHQAEAAAICVKGVQAKLEDCTGWVTMWSNPAMTSKYTWSPTLAINTEGVKAALAVMADAVPETNKLTLDDVVDTSIAGTTP